MIARFRDARAAGGPVSFDLTHTEHDGTVRTLEGKAIAIDDPDEERYAFVAEDVSELHRLRSGLIRADRLASLGTLSASIGHEIGTAAAVALGRLEISLKLIQGGQTPAAVLAELQEAQAALVRAIGVLRDMRALAVGATLGSETCDVGAAIDSVKDVLRSEITRHATVHEARIEGAQVAMSHSRLVQVLLNLVRNAIESFGEGRGTLWIDVSRPSPDRVRVAIADDGPGMTDELREKLFEPFVSTKSEGTGLGLYVCSLLTRLAGGSISAPARDGGGTCVCVELPAAG
jgi:C4-dicarboxylate-specific signal transduction histidine kinase